MNNKTNQDRYAGFVEDAKRYLARRKRIAIAWGLPLPGALLEGFCRPESEVAGIGRLRAVTLGDFILLAELRHPLYDVVACRMTGEAHPDAGKPIKLTVEEVAAALYLWTHPAADMHRLIKRDAGRFWSKSNNLFWSPREADMEGVAGALVLHVLRCFKTSVALEAPSSEGEDPRSTHAPENDGFGWWLGLLGTLMRDFHVPPDDALWEFPLIQAFALHGWHRYTSGRGLELSSDGYIAQAAAELKAVVEN